MADATDPALFEGCIPKRISALASAAAYEAAFDATPIAGAFSHQIAPEGIWVGAQSAAGVLASFEDPPDERARCLAELRARRTPRPGDGKLASRGGCQDNAACRICQA